MDYDEIASKLGVEWTEDEINFVFEYLMRDIDSFVSFAYRILIISETTDKLEKAKDLVQKKFVALFRALHNYDPRKYNGVKDPLKNYLFTIIAREAVRANRKTAKRQERQLREPRPVKEPARPSREEVAEAIKPYLNLLPAHYRRALTFFYLEERSCEEAAQLCGCSVAAFRVRLHRGRKQCQEWRKRNMPRRESPAKKDVEGLPPVAGWRM